MESHNIEIPLLKYLNSSGELLSVSFIALLDSVLPKKCLIFLDNKLMPCFSHNCAISVASTIPYIDLYGLTICPQLFM